MSEEEKKLEETVEATDETPEETPKKPLAKLENPLKTITNGYNSTIETYNTSPIGAKIMTWISIALIVGGLFYLRTLLGNTRITNSIEQRQTEYNKEMNRGNPNYNRK